MNLSKFMNQIDRYTEMFSLRAEELAVYEKLDSTQKRIYNLIRQSFILTQGSRDLELYFFLAIYEFMPEFANITDGFDERVTADYILTIRAPEHHVKSGKPGSDENALTELNF